MKHLSECGRGKLCSALLVTLFAFSAAFAQDYEQQRKDKLNGLDLSGLGKTLFLNAAVTSQHEVDYFKNLSKSKIPKAELIISEGWHSLYERLIDADMRPDRERLPVIDQLIETDPQKLTKSNVVPIGIIDMESIYLTGSEIAANETEKKSCRKVDFDAYEKVRVVSAAVLQEEVYQADVSFRISPELYFSNHMNKLTKLEIDFGDGKAFRSFPITEQLIPHHFKSEGKHQIRIRFSTGGTLYVFETNVNVRQLERIAPYKEFQITAMPISKDSERGDSLARTMLVGGNVRIILGCDQILDKAIIIAEGIDLGQDVFLDNLEAGYRGRFGQYLTEGYDLVLLDYTDGRAAMQDNAQVLKALIQQINTMKSGNIESIVIGESMSGLIARWALTEMEKDGLAHHVRLMLCYDTPHQGANIPVGLTQLMRESNATLLTTVILKFFAKGWRNYYQAFGTPAARQLLLHWGGHLTGGVGNKHPDFEAFRTQLAALGNGGYPHNCRNIAVTHGSMNASDRELFSRYNYGDRILRSWTPFLLQNTNIDIHTSQPNQITNVLRFASWGLFSKAIGISRSYNSPLNDDFLPGGRTNSAVPNKLFSAKHYFDFCFVPTFSAIDYQGPRNTQVERELLNVTVVDEETINRKTPFAAIYGRADNINTPHVTTENIAWDDIGIAEGLLTFIEACPALPKPPVPTIATFNTCYPFSNSRTTEGNTANIVVPLTAPSNGQYIHNWTVLPANQYFTTTGDQITFQAERPDQYEITCVRTYPGRRDVSSTFTTTIWVTNCSLLPSNPEDPDDLAGADSDIDKFDIWENDFLLTTDAGSMDVFAHFSEEETLYATLVNGTFVPRSTLIASGMFPEFAALFAIVDPREALPVRLVNFTAKAEGENAMLEWETASEINSSHFEIQRSNNGKDWQKIGIVNASNTLKAIYYHFTDPNLPQTQIYYRLKMVDMDNTFAYSRMANLVRNAESDIIVYPNPVESDVTIVSLMQNQNVQHVRVYDLAGKLVLGADSDGSSLSMQRLPAGKYVVSILMKDGTRISKAVVKNE